MSDEEIDRSLLKLRGIKLLWKSFVNIDLEFLEDLKETWREKSCRRHHSTVWHQITIPWPGTERNKL